MAHLNLSRLKLKVIYDNLLLKETSSLEGSAGFLTLAEPTMALTVPLSLIK